MKHLSQAPVSPSALRPEIPRDLDYVVLRALAKDPADRYHSAEEMDSDLERIARGIGVSAETAEAATTVLSRTDVGEAATTIGPAAVTSTTYTPGRYYEYDEPPAQRMIWPWLVACADRRRSRRWLVRLPGAAGPAHSRQAGRRARRQGPPRAARRHEHPRRGSQGARAARAERGRRRSASSPSRIRSPATGPRRATSSRSSSRPGRRRPGYRTSSARVGTRPSPISSSAGLKANVVSVNSLRARQHGARDGSEGRHRAGRRVNRPRQRLEGTEAGHGAERDRYRVRERAVLASGRRLCGRPRGGRGSCGCRNGGRPESCRRHAAEQGIRDHAPGLLGPADLAGPGRHEPDRGGRPRQLQQSGFEIQVVEEIVDDQSLDGRVLSQDPEGGTDAEQGTSVVIVVGRFEQPQAPPAETATTTTTVP